MKLPEIINKTIPSLKGLVGNIDDIALVNVLNSKLTNMITQTGVNFKQYSNSKPATLSYYGINFMNSGANKDYVVDCINDYLMPFVELSIKQHIEDYKIQYRQEQEMLRPGAKQAKLIEEEIQQIRVANYEIYNPNYTGLYKEAEQISKIKFGSLFIRIGELGDYLDNIVSGNQSKKELYQKLKDIYEGTVAPSIIAGDNKREILRKIPVQALMYTDFENLLNEKIKKYYLMSLKTGLARRSFIYMPLEENGKICYPSKPEEKSEYIKDLLLLQNDYKNLFDVLNNKRNKTYEMSVEASEEIYKYNCECIDYFNKSKDDIILKLELKESFWKITKLSVVYSILGNPEDNIVNKEAVEMAISFYRAIQPSLKAVIEKRELSEVEKIAQYLYNNRDKEYITSGDIRKTNIIKGHNFSKFFDEIFVEIQEEMQKNYNCYLLNYDGLRGNTKAFYVREG